MSYCRWSSENFKSDVYVFGDIRGGWTIMMASFQKDGVTPINLPHDGEEFRLVSRQDCIRTLKELRTIGYHVPQYAIDRLIEEVMSGTQ